MKERSYQAEQLLKLPPKPENPAKPKKDTSNVIRVLHMSDIHMDSLYSEGSIADCSEPLCCRAGVPESPVGKRLASKWYHLFFLDKFRLKDWENSGAIIIVI